MPVIFSQPLSLTMPMMVGMWMEGSLYRNGVFVPKCMCSILPRPIYPITFPEESLLLIDQEINAECHIWFLKETNHYLVTIWFNGTLFLLKKAEFIPIRIDTYGFNFLVYRTSTNIIFLELMEYLIHWHEILYNNISVQAIHFFVKKVEKWTYDLGSHWSHHLIYSPETVVLLI